MGLNKKINNTINKLYQIKDDITFGPALEIALLDYHRMGYELAKKELMKIAKTKSNNLDWTNIRFNSL